MISLFSNETHPSDAVTRQVLEMVDTNLTDLSLLAVPPSNHLHAIYRWALAHEVYQYIRRIGQMPTAPVELIVAFDDENQSEVVGFLLYLPVASHPDACGVSYMAVKQTHRNRGIGSAMLQQAIDRYPHIELTCPVKKVPFYERLGFKVIDSHITQVVMNTRSASCEGMMGVVNAAEIMGSSKAKEIHASLLSRWGRKEMLNAEKQLARHVDQLTRKAESFVRERIGATVA